MTRRNDDSGMHCEGAREGGDFPAKTWLFGFSARGFFFSIEMPCLFRLGDGLFLSPCFSRSHSNR